jgi:hypothetical protein
MAHASANSPAGPAALGRLAMRKLSRLDGFLQLDRILCSVVHGDLETPRCLLLLRFGDRGGQSSNRKEQFYQCHRQLCGRRMVLPLSSPLFSQAALENPNIDFELGRFQLNPTNLELLSGPIETECYTCR